MLYTLALLAFLLLLVILSRVISKSLLDLLGEGWYVFLLWPGVFVHEVSHLIGALITLTPVRKFSVVPDYAGSLSRVLGFVQHDQPKNPVAVMLVAAFPFVGGIVALWLLTVLLAPALLPSVSVGSWHFRVGSFFALVANFFNDTLTLLTLPDWRTWLFLYLSFAVSAHLTPSRHDLTNVVKAVFSIALIVLVVYGIARSVGISAVDTFFVWVGQYLGGIISKFILVLVYPAMLLVFVAVVAALLSSIKKLVRRR